MSNQNTDHRDITYAVLETNILAGEIYDACIELILAKTRYITDDQISAAFRIAIGYTLEAVRRAAKKLPQPEQRAPTASPTSTSSAAYTRRKECRDFHKQYGELKRKNP